MAPLIRRLGEADSCRIQGGVPSAACRGACPAAGRIGDRGHDQQLRCGAGAGASASL